MADEGGGPHVHAPGGLSQHQQLGVLHDLAAHDELLEVASGEGLGFGGRPAALDVKAGDAVLGEALGHLEADEATAEHALAVGRKEGVLGERQAGDRPPAQALLGHEAHAQGPPAGRVEVAHILAAHAHRLVIPHHLFARDGPQQLLLAVARDPGNAHDLTAAHLQADVPQLGAEGIVRGVVQATELQAQLTFRPGLAVAAGREVLPDHHAGHGLGGLLGRVAGAGHPAPPQHRRPVAELLDLVELVADVEDAHPLGGQLPQGLEELAHRLGREHRGGLIQDEQAGILKQAADDLHPLTFAH